MCAASLLLVTALESASFIFYENISPCHHAEAEQKPPYHQVVLGLCCTVAKMQQAYRVPATKEVTVNGSELNNPKTIVPTVKLAGGAREWDFLVFFIEAFSYVLVYNANILTMNM